MKRLVRRGLLFIVFLLVLQLLLGATTALADPGWHMVRPGETLFSIGRRYGINPYTIAQLNGLANPNYIQIGQLLYIPGPGGCYSPQPQWPYPGNRWGYDWNYWYGYYPRWQWYPRWNWCWWDP